MKSSSSSTAAGRKATTARRSGVSSSAATSSSPHDSMARKFVLPANFDPSEVVLPSGYETTTLGDIAIPVPPRLPGWVGAYSLEDRLRRLARFMSRRNNRVWEKTVKYDVRKNFADSRLRVKGRFVKKEDEALLRDFMQLF